MTKKHFIALADAIRHHNRHKENQFSQDQLETLAEFCKEENSAFYRERWFGYIAGRNGPNGGRVSR